MRKFRFVLAAVAAATTSAVFQPSVATAATNEVTFSEDWGSATLTAKAQARSDAGFSLAYDIVLNAEVTDKEANGRCVFVSYVIDLAHHTDPDGEFGTTCKNNVVGSENGSDDVSRPVAEKVWFSSARQVKFKLCERKRLGRDRCTSWQSATVA